MCSPECCTPTVALASFDIHEAVWVVDCAISASITLRRSDFLRRLYQSTSKCRKYDCLSITRVRGQISLLQTTRVEVS
jgi:hypothetical protein